MIQCPSDSSSNMFNCKVVFIENLRQTVFLCQKIPHKHLWLLSLFCTKTVELPQSGASLLFIAFIFFNNKAWAKNAKVSGTNKEQRWWALRKVGWALPQDCDFTLLNWGGYKKTEVEIGFILLALFTLFLQVLQSSMQSTQYLEHFWH